MTFNDPRSRRRLTPSVDLLESRRLLSFLVTSDGQDGHDLAGPDASQGNSGIVNIHLVLSGLSHSDWSYITVQGPPGFEWESAPNAPNAAGDPGGYNSANGYAFAEWIPNGAYNDEEGDLFIDPEVRSDLPPPGGSLPLGGSTGALLTTLTSSATLVVTVHYETPAEAPDTYTLNGIANFVSATDPMTPPATPNPVATTTFSIQDDGQDGKGPTGIAEYLGLVHLQVTAPSGTFSSSEFSTSNAGETQNGLLFQISDPADLEWISNVPVGNLIDASMVSSSVVNLFFPPFRDEAPANGSSAPNMTLQVTLPGSTTVYATPFAGANWNLSKLLVSPPSQTNNSVTSIGQLQSDLENNYGTIGTIDLAPNHTFISNGPLEINNSVTINGNGDTIEFEQSGAAWPSTATGAIFTYSSNYQNLQITLNDFTIEFANSPIQWTNPSGFATTYYDPLNGSEPKLAVINDQTGNNANNIDDLSLNKMSILGPPAFDSNSSTENYQYLSAHDPNSGHAYAGEPALPLVLASGYGNITGPGTLAGGPVTLSDGPWLVNGNTDEGAQADTYSPAAFSFSIAHDVLLQGNTVTQSASPATLFRLVNFAGYGFNDVVEGNSFGGNAGQLGNEDNYSAGNAQYGGINDPEVMLEEQNNVVFEGRAGAVSSDGLLVVLPEVRDGLTYAVAQNAVVSILSAFNGNGTPDTALAGEWFPVAQVVNISTNNSLELLMQTPLPQMPAGGYYVVELAQGFVNTSFIGNTINLTNKASTGFVTDGSEYGTRLIGNTFIGGETWGISGATGAAIAVATSLDTNATGGVTYLLPQGWTALPTLGILIEDNTIDDSLGGIVIGVNHYINSGSGLVTSASLFGRVYVTATVVGNTFEYDTSFLSAWATTYATLANESGENPDPPTITIGSGFGADAAGVIAGPRYPWTVGGELNSSTLYFIDPTENQVDVQGNITEINNSPESGPTGQVYAGYVNGVDRDATAIPENLPNQPSGYNSKYYYPFNMNTGENPNPDAGLTLDITDAPSNTQGIQAPMLGQDGYDLVGPGTGTPAPDNIQDLHIQLTGLSPTSSLASLTVTDDLDGEVWTYTPSGSSGNQIVVERAPGSTTADVFIQPTIAHVDDTFTIQLTYQTGGPISIPLQGVMFNPSLAVFPTVPQAPLAFGVTAASSSSVSLSWASVAGATSYTLEREPASSPGSWTTLSTSITGTTYSDTSVSGSIAYVYELAAVGALGQSAFSDASATTTSSADTLAATSVAIAYAVENETVDYAVAQFTDNNNRPNSDFTATIIWGDGTSGTGGVTGVNGSYTVYGVHTYSASGDFNVQVQIGMISPYTGSASTVSTAAVSQPLTSVSLSGSFNKVGITTTGSGVEGQLGASGNESYSSTALGGSTVVWNSNPYSLGQPNVDNVVQAAGQTIPVSCTGCTSIDILATATGGVNQGGVFEVTYSGGTYDEDSLGLSDWNLGYNGAGTNAPGESTVLAMNDLDTYSGGTESQTSDKTYLYGYVISTSPGKTITGLVLPSNSKIQVLAIDEIMQPPQVNLSSYFDKVGITSSGTNISGGFFGTESYSASALGGTGVIWGTTLFDLGSPNSNNVMAVAGQSVYVTPGSYSGIQVLAAGVNGYNQSSQFTVFYTDGTSSTFNPAFSDWQNGYTGVSSGSITNAPGETTVLTMSDYNLFSGGTEVQETRNTYLYGYTIPVNPNKTAFAFSPGNNANIVILAVDTVSQLPQVNMGYGSNSVTLPFDQIGITTVLDPTTSSQWGGYSYSSSAAPNGLGNTVTWGSQVFNIGPAGVNNIFATAGQSITLPAGNYTDLEFLGASMSHHYETETFDVYYTDGTHDTFTQGFSDWLAGYNGTGGTTAPGETIVDSMGTFNSQSGQVTGTNMYLYGYVFPLNPAKTVAYVAVPNDSNIKILAMDVVSQPGQDNLAAGTSQAAVADNTDVITSPLTTNLLSGGSFSAAAQPAGLGSTVSWNGQTFNIGPAGNNNADAVNGVSISLPQGNFTSLQLLGASMSGHYENAMFWVHYTDGTFDTFTQDFSDYLNGYNGTARSTAPGESIALTMNTYDEPSGVVQHTSYVYGYDFPLNPNKTVDYLQMTNDVNIKILAIDEVYQPEQVDLAYATDSAAPPDTVAGVTMDGYDWESEGLNGSGDSYSLDLLGSTINWNSQTFDLGPATSVDSVPNAVGVNGSATIPLPQGNYTSIQLLATAVGGNPTSAVFSVNYVGGTTDTFSQGLSDWINGYVGANTTAPGESIVASMSYYDTPSGEVHTENYLYGYVLNTNPTKKVEDIQIVSTSSIAILAIDVVDQPEQVNLGDATLSASPAFDLTGLTMNSSTSVGAGFDGAGDTYSENALGNTVNWDGQTFDIGPASSVSYIPNVVVASGNPPILVPQGHYTSIDVLAAAAYGPVADTWYVDYTDGTYETFTVGASLWMAGYDGAGTTAPWESIADTMASYNSPSGTVTGSNVYVYLYGYVLPTNPAKTVKDVREPNENKLNILAIDTVDQPAQVDLGDAAGSATPNYNVTAITTNSEYTVTGGGLDGSGDTYSANALAASTAGSASMPAWNGQTFVVGPAGINDAVKATSTGQTINLPQGYYTSLQLLGTATGGTAQSGTFTVNYVGGGTATFTQTFSDWQYGYNDTPGSTAPGESIAALMSSYNSSTGNKSGNRYLYAYVFPVNPAKEVASITFPTNTHITILAINEVDQAPQVNLGDSTNEGTPPDNVQALTFNNLTGVTDGGVDGDNDTYSLNALATATGSASTITWGSATFLIGPLYASDAVEATGQTIALPEGSFTSIELLGTGSSGSNQSDTITVNYVGGGDTSLTQVFSDWHAGYNGHPGTTAPGESLIATMSSYNTPSGNQSGNTYLYGYSISTSASLTVASISFSWNWNVTFLAIDEINQSTQYMMALKGGKGPGIGMPGAPGTGSTGSAAWASPPVAVAPALGSDLLSLAIESVVSSAASIGPVNGLCAGGDDPADAPGTLDQPDGGSSSSPGTVMLGPITAPLAPVADYVRSKTDSTASPIRVY